jgi:hypothetical protein
LFQDVDAMGVEIDEDEGDWRMMLKSWNTMLAMRAFLQFEGMFAPSIVMLVTCTKLR